MGPWPLDWRNITTTLKELEKKVEELPRDKQDQLALLDYVIGQLFDLRAKIQADQFARPRGSGYK